MSYYARRIDSNLCRHCQAPLSAHHYVATDRDGDLHSCPTDPVAIAKANSERNELRAQLLATIALAQGEGYTEAASFIREAMKDL